MSESLKVASMVASLSANTTEFEAGMNRAVVSAEKGFAKIGQIQDGGFKEGLKLKGMESKLSPTYNSMASILGDATEKKVADAVANVAKSEKVKNAATVTASTFGEKLSLAMSNKNLFTGIKKVAESGDVLGAAGGIGMALGGWSLAIGAAVSVAKTMAPVMDQILFSTGANVQAAKEYAKSVESAFNATQLGGGSNRIADIFTGKTKQPDWIDHLARNADLATFTGKHSPTVLLEDRMAFLQESLTKLGSQGDFVNAKMGEKFGTTMPFALAQDNEAAAFEFKQQHAQMQAKIKEQMNQLNDLQVEQRAAMIRGGMGLFQDAQAFAGNPANSPDKMLFNFGNALGNANQKVHEFAQGLVRGAFDRDMDRKNAGATWNPFERFDDEMRRVQNLADTNQISDDVANRLRGQARQNLDAAIPMMKPQFASLIRANSAEASKAILATMLPKTKAEDRPLQDLKAEAETQTEILREIGRNTAKQFQAANF